MDRCDEIARTYKLSAREEEVLLLLAQRKTVGIIERELLIANGTAKAHVRHIYQKLDIHTRQELFDLLGLDGRETGPQGLRSGIGGDDGRDAQLWTVPRGLSGSLPRIRLSFSM